MEATMMPGRPWHQGRVVERSRMGEDQAPFVVGGGEMLAYARRLLKTEEEIEEDEREEERQQAQMELLTQQIRNFYELTEMVVGVDGRQLFVRPRKRSEPDSKLERLAEQSSSLFAPTLLKRVSESAETSKPDSMPSTGTMPISESEWKQQLKNLMDEDLEQPEAKANQQDHFSELREAWGAPLSTKPSATAVPTRITNSSKERRTKNLELKRRFRRHRKLLKTEKGTLQSQLRSLTAEDKRLAASIGEDIERFQSWSKPYLVRSCRELGQLKRARLHIQQAITEHQLQLITQKHQQTCDILTGMKSGERVHINGLSLAEPESIYATDSALMLLQKRLQVIDSIIPKQLDKFLLSLNTVNAESAATRTEHFDALVALMVLDDRGYHPIDHKSQEKFDCLIRDERFKEGRKIKRLQEALHEAAGKFAPEDILMFLESTSQEIAEDNSLSDPQAPDVIRLYMARSLYPIIHDQCFELSAVPSSSPHLAPAAFYIKLFSLKDLTPQHLQVETQFCQPLADEEGEPSLYTTAVNILLEVTFATVPIDIMYILKQAVQHINSEGQMRSKATVPLGADDLFPLCAYVICKAQIHNINHILNYVEQFSCQKDMSGEFGWCLTTCQAAAEYLASWNPQLTE